jgi:hypothetical protein
MRQPEELVTSFDCESNGGIILPFNENLCWLKEVSDEILPWSKASSYCFEKNNDESSFFVPTKEEWESLINYLESKGITENLGSYLNNNYGFIGFKDTYYWSATHYGAYGSSFVSWYIDLENGLMNTWSMDHSLNVVCVLRN